MSSPPPDRPFIRLHEVAHARSGDKGNHANIGVIAWTGSGFAFLEQVLTEEVVASFFKPLQPQRVQRFCLPGIQAFNFVLENVLDGGASGSLRSDSQGKALAGLLLQLPLPTPDGWEEMLRPDA